MYPEKDGFYWIIRIPTVAPDQRWEPAEYSEADGYVIAGQYCEESDIVIIGPEIPQPPPLPRLCLWLDEKEFFDFMQRYRNCPLSAQMEVSLRFEDVKAFIRGMVLKNTIKNSTADAAKENPVNMTDA